MQGPVADHQVLALRMDVVRQNGFELAYCLLTIIDCALTAPCDIGQQESIGNIKIAIRRADLPTKPAASSL